MSSLPLLTMMMVVPLLGAIIVAALPGDSARLAKPIALGASLVTLVLALMAWARFDTGATEQFQLAACTRGAGIPSQVEFQFILIGLALQTDTRHPSTIVPRSPLAGQTEGENVQGLLGDDLHFSASNRIQADRG